MKHDCQARRPRTPGILLVEGLGTSPGQFSVVADPLSAIRRRDELGAVGGTPVDFLFNLLNGVDRTRDSLQNAWSIRLVACKARACYRFSTGTTGIICDPKLGFSRCGISRGLGLKLR
jgi:hypothetical protein